MPTITMWAPTSRAFSSAALRLARTFASKLDDPVIGQPARRDVDLEVELAELGHEVGIGDRLEHLGVLHRRVAGVVDEVQLDLEAGHRTIDVEPRLAQHPREDVETLPHLLAIARAILAGELPALDVLAHREVPSSCRQCPACPRQAATATGERESPPNHVTTSPRQASGVQRRD